MDFVEKEFIFLSFCWLSLGALGTLVTPYPNNKAVTDQTPNQQFVCTSDKAGSSIDFFFLAVGSDKFISTKSPDQVGKFGADTTTDKKQYRLTMPLVGMAHAGVYYCADIAKVYVQLIVLSGISTCNFFPRQTKQLLCTEKINLTSTVSYSANWTYVVPNMQWRVDALQRNYQGSIETTTVGNLTTATSTLTITWPVDNPGTIPIYSCTTSFGVVGGLSSEFITKTPTYTHGCSPFKSYDDVPCTNEEPKIDVTTVTADKKNAAPTVTAEKNNAAPTVTTENKNAALTVTTAKKNNTPTFTTVKKTVTTTDDVVEQQRDDNTASIVSSDTNIVLLSVAGSLLLAQAF